MSPAKTNPVETPMAKGAALPTIRGTRTKAERDGLLAEAKHLLRDYEPFTPGWEYHMGTILRLSLEAGAPVREW